MKWDVSQLHQEEKLAENKKHTNRFLSLNVCLLILAMLNGVNDCSNSHEINYIQQFYCKPYLILCRLCHLQNNLS